MLFSSTTIPGQTSAMSSSLVTSSPRRLTMSSRISKARCPSATGTPWANSSRRAANKRNGPNTRASVIGVTRRLRLGFDEPQREPVAAVPALVAHVVREAAHQMDAELGLLERRRLRRRRRSGGIELPAVILDAGDQRPGVALELDGDLQPIALGGAVHDDVGHGLFEAKRNRERNVGGHVLPGQAFDPAGEPLELGEIVAQNQPTCFQARHRGHDPSAALAALSVWWIGISASIFAVLRTLATLLSGHRMTKRPPLPPTILAPTSSTRMA